MVRRIFFWLHLLTGLVAGMVILVMCATGAALAFEKEITAWAERDLRRVIPPPEPKFLPIEELIQRVRFTDPEGRLSGLTVWSDPALAVQLSFGRTNTFHVNPYTGEVRSAGASGTRAFLRVMTDWHRYLGQSEERRPLGKALTGAGNLAFCFLVGSGLYLWWPRRWSKKVLRPITWFNLALRGKARDWNWHHVLGFWSAPVLLVLTLTALPISYQWAGDLIYRLTGTTAPNQSGPPGSAPTATFSSPQGGAKPLTSDALLAVVKAQAPGWSQITLRLAGGGPRGGGGAEREAGLALTVLVKESSAAPRFATTRFTLHSHTGEVLRTERFSDYTLARRIRTWMRFLHTGEALGVTGQFIAALASLAGVFLVYTGLALTWRRFFRRDKSAPAA